MPPVVTVHVAASGTERVPDTIFGSFLEPIGNSINNGIAAEILVNRSLEGGLWNHTNLENMFREQPELIESSNGNGLPLPWVPVNPSAGNRFELHVGAAANSWQSVEMMGLPNEEVGIMQKVYLPVHRVLSYNVSLYAKHMSGPSQLSVQFRDAATGKVLATSTIEASGAEWTKYRATLQLARGQVRRLEAVNFAVAITGNERVDVDQLSLTPTDAIDGMDPDEVALAKAMHITELRFGGNFSSYYHWKDGIGPEDKRVTTENIAWGIPEYNNFGTDEFLKFCDLLGAVPQFDLNMGSGTPEEAAEWVQYIRAHHKGRVLYELGNELYGKWQVGYPTLDEIAARTLVFSKAVKAVAPDAELIATGSGPFGGAAWNAAQLSNPAGTFDYLSFHYIQPTNRPVKEAPSPDFTAAAAYAIPFAAGPAIDRMQSQLEAKPDLHGKVHFAVTEWLFNSKGYGERNFTNESPSWMNAGGAVMAAGFLNTVLRHTSSIKITDMTGLMEFAGVWKRREQVYAVPAFYAFQMYTTVKGDTVLPVTSDTGTYSLEGGDRPAEKVTDVPLIDVVATRSADGKFVTLLCVNRSVSEDVPTTFDLGALRVTGVAKLQLIKAESRYERNDEIEPNHVIPFAGVAQSVKPGVSVTLPHESVTVIRVPVQ
jgi:alpha-N-arabinofuranosidase